MIPPTIVYFGSGPTTIVFQAIGDLDGTAQTEDPVLSPAVYAFPPQNGGGLYDFHQKVGTQEAVAILGITYNGGGTLTISRVFSAIPGTQPTIIGTIETEGDFDYAAGQFILTPGQNLVFTTEGANNPIVAVTAMLARCVNGDSL